MWVVSPNQANDDLGCLQRGTTQSPTNTATPMNITANSTKAAIIDESMVIITTQDEEIAALKEQRTALFILLSVVTALLLIG